MKRFYRISVLILGTFFILFSCFADQGTSDKQAVRHRLIDNMLDKVSKNLFEDSDIKCLLALSQGYDDNVHLNSRRFGDTFTQILFKPTITTALNEKTDRILGYELLSMIYGDESNLNLLTNTFSLGLDHKINKDLNLLSQYSLGIVDYPNTGEDDFIDNALAFKLKQKLPNKVYHSLGYEFCFKDYTDRSIRTSTGVISAKEREDRINTIKYEIGKFTSKDLIRINYTFDNNNSNDTYLKYYDYDSFKPAVSLTHFFDKKTFLFGSFSRQMRYFRSRTLSVDTKFKEWDKTYAYILGLYYSPKKSFTVGVNYTYRQNCSNEPLENYSGSIVTLNTYYNF